MWCSCSIYAWSIGAAYHRLNIPTTSCLMTTNSIQNKYRWLLVTANREVKNAKYYNACPYETLKWSDSTNSRSNIFYQQYSEHNTAKLNLNEVCLSLLLMVCLHTTCLVSPGVRFGEKSFTRGCSAVRGFHGLSFSSCKSAWSPLLWTSGFRGPGMTVFMLSWFIRTKVWLENKLTVLIIYG